MSARLGPVLVALLLATASFAMPLAARQSTPGASPSAATPAAPAYDPQTGDAWIDARLKDLNAYAPRYPEAFVDEIARYLEVPRGYVVALGQQPGWMPGDVYFACALAKALAQPCRAVVRARAANPEDSWQAIAKRVAGEHQTVPTRTVRDLLRTSYAHWARPLD